MTFPALATDEVRARLENGGGLSTVGGALHGGAVMSLAELAAAVLTGLAVPEGAGWTTGESTTYFLRPVTTAGATARARPLRVGRAVVTVDVDVLDDDERRCARTSQLMLIQPAGG